MNTLVSLSKRLGKTRAQEIVILARKAASERNFNSPASPDRCVERTSATPRGCPTPARGHAADVHLFPTKKELV